MSEVDVVQCHRCKEKGVLTLHGNTDSRCPVCDAAAYWQCKAGEEWSLSEDHPLAIEMQRQERVRMVQFAIKGADDETMNRIRQLLQPQGMTYNEMIAKYFPNRGEPDISDNLTGTITGL